MTTQIEDRECVCEHFYGNHEGTDDPDAALPKPCIREDCDCWLYAPGEPLAVHPSSADAQVLRDLARLTRATIAYNVATRGEGAAQVLSSTATYADEIADQVEREHTTVAAIADMLEAHGGSEGDTTRRAIAAIKQVYRRG